MFFKKKYKKINDNYSIQNTFESKEREIIERERQIESIKSMGIFTNITENLYITTEIINDGVAESLGFTTTMYVGKLATYTKYDIDNRIKVYIDLNNINNIDMRKNIVKYIDKGRCENNMLIYSTNYNILILVIASYILEKKLDNALLLPCNNLPIEYYKVYYNICKSYKHDIYEPELHKIKLMFPQVTYSDIEKYYKKFNDIPHTINYIIEKNM